MLKVAALISGSGTTLMAIYNAILEGKLPGVEIACIISSKPDAGGIEKATKAGFPPENIHVLRKRDYKNENAYGEAMLAIFEQHSVNFFGQYGWLVHTPDNVVDEFQGRSTNQHCGPLDPGYSDFGGDGMHGRRVHAARLIFAWMVSRSCMWTEAVSQYVYRKYDTGPIIRREGVEILDDDTVESLQARVLLVEHRVQIETLCDFANGNVPLFERKERLVFPDEIWILELAKFLAKKLYPKG